MIIFDIGINSNIRWCVKYEITILEIDLTFLLNQIITNTFHSSTLIDCFQQDMEVNRTLYKRRAHLEEQLNLSRKQRNRKCLTRNYLYFQYWWH